MEKKTVCVSDTSTLIRLRKGSAIFCLNEFFEKIYIPLAVRDECLDPETSETIKDPIFQIYQVKNLLPVGGIARGELEAISLAVELNLKLILIDDHKAYDKASALGLNPLRSFDILILAKQLGVLSSVTEILKNMKDKREGIDDEIYFETLRKVGEL